MAGKFKVKCEGCGKLTAFETTQVEGLDAHIAGEREDAVEMAEEDSRDDLLADLGGHNWTLAELAQAVRMGDRAEAEALIDRIARSLGVAAQEQVALGRFNRLTRAA
jgi:hypothetical protein